MKIMFTLFHALLITSSCAGLAIGSIGGNKYFGAIGGLIGGLLGLVAGYILGRLPYEITRKSIAKDLAKKSSDELRASLHNGRCGIPNCTLVELKRRGENIQTELSIVLDMLVSESFDVRGRGWVALRSAYPELSAEITDYRINDLSDECREKIEKLKQLVPK